ncbi:MAG: hypothetical protein K6T63_02610 [Alicyclobacillus herbarius]|uniref:hypothetical protein n=1 Tax=Alicyclobacillus herbarius TaxID=122960 RepID=UPI002357990E|nr:hypothetical protein [Alicyclobacillus herbarius]MCL6631500.1 hypothetical protein [Alicyclobacillus herbarius]
MSGGWLDYVRVFACLLLMAGAIKVMDDYLDRDFDLTCGKRTLAARLERSALPYGLVLALVATFLDLRVALAVFFGSYAVGMFANWKEKMPTHLPAYVEIVASIILACLFSGWQTALWGIAMMAAIDWLDDLLDRAVDRRSGQRNLASKMGTIETLLLVLAALGVAVLVNASLTVLAFLALPMIIVLDELTTQRLWKTSEEDGVNVP